LADAPSINFLEDISPDGKTALYSTNALGVRSVFSIRLDGAQGSRGNPVVQTGEVIYNARFSPDGLWIVYNLVPGIFVQPFPGPGLRRQISSSGSYPVWRKDGKEIVYVDFKSGRIFSIEVGGSNENLSFGSPVPLFALPPSINLVTGSNPMAVTRDGSHILFPQALEQTEDSNVIHIKSGCCGN
jgi:hypothetical protein